MQTLEITADRLPDFARLQSDFRAARAETVERLGVKMLKTVMDEIPASGVNDAHGKVQSWQDKHIGSGRGYAAVRATTSAAGMAATGKQSPGAITNYLEAGHVVRSPSGRAKRYTPKVHKARTTAYRFYWQSDRRVQQLANEEALRLSQTLAKQVEACT